MCFCLTGNFAQPVIFLRLHRSFLFHQRRNPQVSAKINNLFYWISNFDVFTCFKLLISRNCFSYQLWFKKKTRKKHTWQPSTYTFKWENSISLVRFPSCRNTETHTTWHNVNVRIIATLIHTQHTHTFVQTQINSLTNTT